MTLASHTIARSAPWWTRILLDIGTLVVSFLVFLGINSIATRLEEARHGAHCSIPTLIHKGYFITVGLSALAMVFVIAFLFRP